MVHLTRPPPASVPQTPPLVRAVLVLITKYCCAAKMNISSSKYVGYQQVISHVLSEPQDAALPAPAVVVAATLAPGPDRVVQDHELGVAVVVDVDNLRSRPRGDGGRRAVVPEHNLGKCVTISMWKSSGNLVRKHIACEHLIVQHSGGKSGWRGLRGPPDHSVHTLERSLV